jgi:hypothetical protein
MSLTSMLISRISMEGGALEVLKLALEEATDFAATTEAVTVAVRLPSVAGDENSA